VAVGIDLGKIVTKPSSGSLNGEFATVRSSQEVLASAGAESSPT